MATRTNWAVLQAAALTAAIGLPAVADELHVPGEYATIQAAINAATNGDEVIVAPGTYTEALNLLGKVIAVRGSGGSAVTTLDGAGLGTTIVLCESGETLDTIIEGFTFRNGEGADRQNCSPALGSGGAVYVRWSSLTVRDCDFVDNGVDRGLRAGGAICAFNGGLRVERCGFTGNGRYTQDIDAATLRGGAVYVCNPSISSGLEIIGSSFTSNFAGSRGAAVYVVSPGPVTILSSTFEGNATDYGAGVFASTYSGLLVEDCLFQDNESAYGAGINLYVSREDGISPAIATVRRCTFSGGSASFGGGLNLDTSATALVEDCTFLGNKAAFGGGMSLYMSSADETYQAAVVTVDRCEFEGNSGGFGGGLEAQLHRRTTAPRTPPQFNLTNCRFTANTALGCCDVGVYGSECGRDGSNNGLYAGGAADLRTFYGGLIKVMNCEIVANEAVVAGGLHMASCGGGEIRVINSTVAENTAGGLHLRLNEAQTFQDPSTMEVHNSIAWGNGAGSGEGLVIVSDGGDSLSHAVSYSDIEGGAAGEGNIDADPLFRDAPGGDFSLRAGSPSIDAADNTAVPAGTPLDLAGNPRFVDDPGTADTGVPGGQGGDLIVDMGAYEFQGSGCRADVNGDGVLDTRDFVAFLDAWAHQEPLADWNGDGTIDTRDFISYLDEWAAGC